MTLGTERMLCSYIETCIHRKLDFDISIKAKLEKKKDVEEGYLACIFIVLFGNFEQLEYQLADLSSAIGIYYATSK